MTYNVQQDPATKKLDFKNFFGENLPVNPLLYMNLFSLKFETGSYFLKSMKKCCTLGKITRVNIENLLWRHRCLITPNTR